MTVTLFCQTSQPLPPSMKIPSYNSLLLSLALGCASSLSAQIITPVGVSGSGLHFNSFDLVSDGITPDEGSFWLSSSNVWWTAFRTSITLDLGLTYQVNDLLASVDNESIYKFSHSLDGVTFTDLFTIMPAYGEIGGFPFRMDTMSTDSASSEYVAEIDFAPIATRYIRVTGMRSRSAISAVGEISAFGSPFSEATPVPEPSTYGLVGAATLFAWIGLRRARRTQSQ